MGQAVSTAGYLAPITAIERPVLDGLGDVSNGERALAFEICDGTGDFLDAVVWVGGISKPEFLMAACTRPRLSRTAASGRPTVWK